MNASATGELSSCKLASRIDDRWLFNCLTIAHRLQPVTNAVVLHRDHRPWQYSMCSSRCPSNGQLPICPIVCPFHSWRRWPWRSEVVVALNWNVIEIISLQDDMVPSTHFVFATLRLTNYDQTCIPIYGNVLWYNSSSTVIQIGLNSR